MGLVEYSDSDGSDAEVHEPVPKPRVTKPSTKPTFQKLVDKANPGKIRVGTPTNVVSAEQRDSDDIDAPPAKRTKTGGGFSGFNAMLPAPKKTGQTPTGGTTAPKKGLGVGVNLRTSGQAAFSREAVESSTSYDDYGTANGSSQAGYDDAAPAARKEPEVKLVGKPTIFKPLSVASKMGKKRKTVAELAAAATAGTSVASSAPARQGVATAPSAVPVVSTLPTKTKTKVSLFSIGVEEAQPAASVPDLEGHDENEDDTEEAFWPGSNAQQQPAPSNYGTNGGQEVDIASDLNLTAAERRQLFGRQGKGDISAMNIVNFNTDDEYARNEALRASGEADAAAQHRGVKAIAPGKHSLKQLVNAATSQKDALEDSFAQGRKNKKEAGNKYGW